MERWIGLAGAAVLLGVAFLLSRNRAAIKWKTVGWGMGLQLLVAVFVLRLSLGKNLLQAAANGVTRLVQLADHGSGFLFGWLVTDPAPEKFVFAFKVLPIVIFISSLFSCLYYLGIMQIVVAAMARVMTRLMGVSGAESLAAAANVFMGQTEAPIVIAPYIPAMTASELLALMAGGMATVSGAVLGGYVALGIDPAYLVTASVMAAPGSLVMAKIILPETEISQTAGRVSLKIERTDSNLIEAAARGASVGATLAINIAAVLIAFISLVFLINGVLGWIGGWIGIDVSLQSIFGYALYPLAFIMGVPAADASAVGRLLGLKLVLNEFVAYVDLAQLKAALSPRSELIATYALCGFANFSSIGVQIGGIGGLAPTRRSDFARLGLRALAAGFMASCLSAAIAGAISGK
ncbi:MAG: NupC/NupG family nucleoside CNT transporter [Acidobacteria bacterium]|nr:MAG: NupC/NupG family nucleoside CNT transporter [Acidobacteriota bacterium]